MNMGTTAGRVTMQRMAVSCLDPTTLNFDATYTWDDEGRIASRTYPPNPRNTAQPGPAYTYQFDSIGRMNTMVASHDWVVDTATTIATAGYGPAGEMTSLSYYNYSETRSYNSLLQLTRQTIPGVLDMEYVFPAGQNNGRISSSIDHINNVQANYGYDALNRMVSAQAVQTPGGQVQWGQTYTFDGFGNLTAKNVTAGSGTGWSETYDPATNRVIGDNNISYDANGNTYYAFSLPLGYDVENRISVEGACPNCSYLNYDPAGKRVLVVQPNASTWTAYFYDIFGKRVATLPSGSNIKYTVYFGDRLIAEWAHSSTFTLMATDRLGSVRANSNNETFDYLPYGEERAVPTTPNDRVKFGTYFRDSATYAMVSQDYADQRYYNPGYGRFNTPDPFHAGPNGWNLGDPGSWNQYAYTGGDPINRNDPSGLQSEPGPPSPQSCDVGGLAFPIVFCSGIGGGGSFAFIQIDNKNAAAKVNTAQRQALNRAFNAAREALANPDCASFFGQPTVLGTLTMTPVDVLNQIGTSSYRFTGDSSFPFDGVTAFNETVILGVRVGWSASITLNPQLVDDPTELMLTVLHEAGHVMAKLGFNGNFRDDDGPNQPENQKFNDDQIKKDCLKNP